MLNTEWNMSKHGFSLIRICTYMDRIWDSVHIWENTDVILIQTEKLRLFCWRLRGGLHYILPYLLWSYAGSLKLFRESWQHHKLDPKQSVTIFFLRKKTSVVKKIVYSEPNKHTSLFKSNIFVYILEIIANRFKQICNGQN